MIRQISLFILLLWMAGCQSADTTLFSKLSSSSTGITFKNTLKETPEFNVMKYSYFYNGGGVATGDLDKDGRCDIFFTGNLVASQLYLNQGNWKFKNIAKEAGIEAAGLWNTGVTMADVNQDGWLDIYICRSAAKDPNGRRNLLFINNGKNDQGQISFSEEAAIYGLNDPAYSTQAAFFDFDRDGDLDMYLLNHSVPEFANFNNRIGHLKSRPNDNYSDKLYRNDQGFFTDVSEEAGLINNVLGFGLGVAIADFNQDRWPDIYVSNDYNEEDYLYINQQNGTFQEQLSENIDHTSLFSMGSDAADINNDGLNDIVTLDMLPQDNYRIKLTSGSDNFNKYQLLLEQGFYKQNMRNMVQLNQGSGAFSEVGQIAGVSNSDWSWSALIADYDLDGWQDLFVTNGYLRDYTNMDFMSYAVDMTLDDKDLTSDENIEELLQHMPEINEPNKIYKNQSGFVFTDSSDQWGFSEKSVSNGASYADLDNDGDLDLVINNVNDFAGIYRNQAVEQKLGNFIKIRLDPGKNQPSIGTSLTLFADTLKMHRELFPTRGYQSSVEPLFYFGLGQLTKIDSLLVHWPDGFTEKFDYIEPNSLFIVKKSTGSPTKLKQPGKHTSAIFEEIDYINHKHQEDNFNDFARQSLLPKYYSRFGPPLISEDLNRDGWMDVICGGAAGQPTAAFYGNSAGQFKTMVQPGLKTDSLYEDVAMAISDVNNDGHLDLLIASGGNMVYEADRLYELRCYLANSRGIFERDRSFPTIKCNAATISVADFDHDGDDDIFLGSLYQAQKYPLAEVNHVLINDGEGNFTTSAELPFAHRHTAASTACDYDMDGNVELVIAGEWEPLEVWGINNGNWQLEQSGIHRGWYSSLHTANLDDDPELEIVVGNWGLNSQLQADVSRPIILYAGDFDQNGTIDPVLSSFVGSQSHPFVSRDDLVGQMPGLKKFFTSYHDYANYSMAELLAHLPDAQADTINSLNSVLFDLTEGKLKEKALPLEAQVSPIYSIVDLDFDGDGDLDLILAGNSNYNRVKIGEVDANHGILLENTGGLGFKVVPNEISGLRLTGDIRSIIKTQSASNTVLSFGINDGQVKSYLLNQSNPL